VNAFKLLWLVVVMLALFASGCANSSGEAQEQSFPQTVPPGATVVRVVRPRLDPEEVQRLAPFDVRVPSYVPPHVFARPDGAVVTITDPAVPGTKVVLTYWLTKEREVPYMEIEQTNQGFTLAEPSEQLFPKVSRISVSGMPVNVTAGAGIFGHSRRGLLTGDEGFYFQWKQDGRLFILRILTQDKEEAFKVVASIIQG